MGEHDSEFVKQQYERASDETTHPKSRMGAPEDLSPTTQTLRMWTPLGACLAA